MIKLIDILNEVKLTNDIRIHMSKQPMELEQRSYNQDTGFKPNGFWYGFGQEWINWCKSEMPEWVGKYIYEVNINNSNILRINTFNELIEFNQKYAVDTRGMSQIDWKKVTNEYDGIEINPYQYKARLKLLWYYGWDIASGCIWNLKNTKLELISNK